jgi:DNA polymerase III delta subunit
MAKSSMFQDFKTSLKLAKEGIAQSGPTRLFVIWGPSEYFSMRALSALKDAFQAKTGTQATLIEAQQINQDDFYSFWDQPPLFAGESNLLIKRAEKKKDLIQWLSKIKKIDHLSVTMVLQLGVDKLPAKWQSELSRLNGKTIPSFEPSASELPGFIHGLAKKFALTLSREAIGALLDLVGNDYFKLENELQKLSLIFHSHPSELKIEDIYQALGLVHEDQAFALADFILHNRGDQAQLLKESLLLRGESPLAILGILARHCRNAMTIHQQLQGFSANNPSLRLPFHVRKSYQDYCKNMPMPALAEALQFCQRADGMMKSSPVSDSIILGLAIDKMLQTSS